VPTVAETAYPRLKNQVREKELTEIYTPTRSELNLANQYTRKGATKLGFLVLLKTFQRLGYFVSPTTVPSAIVEQIARSADVSCPTDVLNSYETSGTRWRHIIIIRDYLAIHPYQAQARRIIVKSMAQASQTKNDLADIINVAIEELVHHRYELPVFNTLVRAAKRVRGIVDRDFYRQVRQYLNLESCQRLDSLFTISESTAKTPWQELKQDPGKPILKNLKALVWRLKWLSELNTYQNALFHTPNVKLKHFATEEEQTVQLLDLEWIPQKWWQLITNQKNKKSYPDAINRRYFEMCVFSQVMWELKSEDLYVEDSDAFADYRTQQISWTEYEANIDEFGKLVDLPVEPKSFVAHVKNWLLDITQKTDQSFPNNQSVRLEQGRPVLKRPKKQVDSKKLAQIESLIAERLKPVNLLDILTDTELWLNWTQYFRLLSGHESKIEDLVSRYLAATFCYGCNLGSSQTANSLSNFDRKQIAYVNQRHIGLPSLEKAIYRIINAYNRFSLPKFWGSGKRVSADGTKWDIYEQNLLAEYHIRYGGYGGIGYYHVSDTYIALFSHFISCGVWEAVYILDGLLKNTSDIQPDTIHADTQGQSTPVFALAYLLGIKLMPRIRSWQDLTLCRPDKQVRYDHIDELFTDVIDWKLIETHVSDMLRVVLSIKAGKFTASTILQKPPILDFEFSLIPS
jgi:hypothetical protein